MVGTSVKWLMGVMAIQGLTASRHLGINLKDFDPVGSTSCFTRSGISSPFRSQAKSTANVSGEPRASSRIRVAHAASRKRKPAIVLQRLQTCEKLSLCPGAPMPSIRERR